MFGTSTHPANSKERVSCRSLINLVSHLIQSSALPAGTLPGDSGKPHGAKTYSDAQYGAQRDSCCAHIFFGETTNNPHVFSGVRDFAGGSVVLAQSLVFFADFCIKILETLKKKEKRGDLYNVKLSVASPFFCFSFHSTLQLMLTSRCKEKYKKKINFYVWYVNTSS